MRDIEYLKGYDVLLEAIKALTRDYGKRLNYILTINVVKVLDL